MEVEVSRSSKKTCMLFRSVGWDFSVQWPVFRASRVWRSYIYFECLPCCGTFLSVRWLFLSSQEKVGSLCKIGFLQGKFNRETNEFGCANTIIEMKAQGIYDNIKRSE